MIKILVADPLAEKGLQKIAEMAGVEENPIACLETTKARAGDDVPGCQLGELVDLTHEALTVAVDQLPAGTSDRFGQQWHRI